MPNPKLTTSKSVVTVTHVETVTRKEPDYLDIITVLLPLLTFVAGYYLNNIVENRKERKRLKEVKEYFLTLAKALEQAIYTQSQAVQKQLLYLRLWMAMNLLLVKVRH